MDRKGAKREVSVKDDIGKEGIEVIREVARKGAKKDMLARDNSGKGGIKVAKEGAKEDLKESLTETVWELRRKVDRCRRRSWVHKESGQVQLQNSGMAALRWPHRAVRYCKGLSHLLLYMI